MSATSFGSCTSSRIPSSRSRARNLIAASKISAIAVAMRLMIRYRKIRPIATSSVSSPDMMDSLHHARRTYYPFSGLLPADLTRQRGFSRREVGGEEHGQEADGPERGAE